MILCHIRIEFPMEVLVLQTVSDNILKFCFVDYGAGSPGRIAPLNSVMSIRSGFSTDLLINTWKFVPQNGNCTCVEQTASR